MNKVIKIVDLTPKTTFYIVRDGKVVAARFTSIKISLDLQSVWGTDDYNHFLNTTDETLELTTATNEQIKLCSRSNPIYLTPHDAVNRINKVELKLTQMDMWDFFKRHNCPAKRQDWQTMHGTRFSFNVWVYAQNGDNLGARFVPIKEVDILNGIITAYDRNNAAYTKFYTSKDECLADNTYDVVDFDDEPAEDEQPTENNDRNVHIMFIEIVHQ